MTDLFIVSVMLKMLKTKTSLATLVKDVDVVTSICK